ncbi:MAG: cyclohexanecarboxylate-CoA ligase [Acidimicrobiales bacterium]|jgi:acyl-CoA synthetase (AMP-forming)/AMP-acid ligase II
MFFETTLTQARISAMDAAGVWPNVHLVDRFTKHAETRADSPIVIDRQGTMTWREAKIQVDHLTRGLVEIGVRQSDVVQIQLPNQREFLLLVLAIERIGAVVNPIAPIFRTNEVAVMSELARPTVVVTVDSFRGFALADMHVALREQAPWVQTIVRVPTSNTTSSDASPPPTTSPDTMAWSELLATGAGSLLSDQALDLMRPSVNDVCELIFTSGTTGQPKGVMHTQNTLNATSDLWLDRVAPDCSVFHMASTLAHQTGYLYGVRAPITAGGCVVYQEVWDPVEFAQQIESHHIEASMGATPFLADLLDVEGLTERDLSSFKSFVCAGAPIPLPVLERARDELPCIVLPGWGMSETGLSTIGQRHDPFDKLSTDGLILPGNLVRVVDESGVPVDTGVEGDLQFQGSEIFVGYAQGRELTESCFRDGWFDTGDRAILDDDGYLSISGRTKDIIIRGGENIPVKEVEDVLLRHPNVINVAIIAKPHPRLGEVGCAVVLPHGDPPTLVALTNFLDEHQVTKQFWPEALIIVDEFPMTPSGKIQKFQLRSLVS